MELYRHSRHASHWFGLVAQLQHLDNGSCLSREAHVKFRESVKGTFLCATHLFLSLA
jgi:hypothetical protein